MAGSVISVILSLSLSFSLSLFLFLSLSLHLSLTFPEELTFVNEPHKNNLGNRFPPGAGVSGRFQEMKRGGLLIGRRRDRKGGKAGGRSVRVSPGAD